MGIGNIGWSEFILILAFALIFFGPRRLPGIAQAIGKSLREFQKALNEVKSEIAQASKEADTGPELKRIAPHPAEFFTPDPAVAESAPAPEEPETAEGADVSAPEDASPEEKSAQHGDS
jgi:sec-independent protein translocase protein TatA